MIKKILRSLAGILLIPIAIGTGKAFYLLVSGISIFSNELYILERGVLAYLLLHVFVMRPAYLYVLGHEFVHVLATWLCGGKVISFNVKPSGGSVGTSKTNFFIELSPYFIPIYTIILAPLFMLLRAIGVDIPYMTVTFIFLVGATLAFHFAMTSEVLRLQQSDIMKSGVIFSFMLIFICNLIIVMAVFSPIFENLSFTTFIKTSTDNSAQIYRQIYGKALEFVNMVKIW